MRSVSAFLDRYSQARHGAMQGVVQSLEFVGKLAWTCPQNKTSGLAECPQTVEAQFKRMTGYICRDIAHGGEMLLFDRAQK